MNHYNIVDLRRIERHLPLPEDVNFEFIRMINQKLNCGEFVELCKKAEKERLFGEIMVVDQNFQVVIKATVLSGILTKAFPFDIINYKPKLPFVVMFERSIMNPTLLKPKKQNQ